MVSERASGKVLGKGLGMVLDKGSGKVLGLGAVAAAAWVAEFPYWLTPHQLFLLASLTLASLPFALAKATKLRRSCRHHHRRRQKNPWMHHRRSIAGGALFFPDLTLASHRLAFVKAIKHR